MDPSVRSFLCLVLLVRGSLFAVLGLVDYQMDEDKKWWGTPQTPTSPPLGFPYGIL